MAFPMQVLNVNRWKHSAVITFPLRGSTESQGPRHSFCFLQVLWDPLATVSFESDLLPTFEAALSLV